jgi:hypothetical protein
MELDGFYYSKADQMTQDNPVHAFTNCLNEIHFKIIHDSELMSSTLSFPCIFHDTIYYAFLSLYGRGTGCFKPTAVQDMPLCHRIERQ